MYVYARYHSLTALAAPLYDTALDLRTALRIVRRLRKYYALPGAEFWQQAKPNPLENVTWQALREIIIRALENPPPARPPAAVTSRVAARQLGLTPDKFRREVNLGRIAHIGPNRKKRFAADELERWRAANA